MPCALPSITCVVNCGKDPDTSLARVPPSVVCVFTRVQVNLNWNFEVFKFVECFVFTIVQLWGNFNKDQSSEFEGNRFNVPPPPHENSKGCETGKFFIINFNRWKCEGFSLIYYSRRWWWWQRNLEVLVFCDKGKEYLVHCTAFSQQIGPAEDINTPMYVYRFSSHISYHFNFQFSLDSNFLSLPCVVQRFNSALLKMCI